MRTTSVNNPTNPPSSTPAASLLENAPLAQGKSVKKAKDKQQATGTRPASSSGSNYDVKLSSDAKELAGARARAYDIASKTSPIREDRVAELKAKIANGTYKVDSGKVADGILTEAIKEELAQSSL